MGALAGVALRCCVLLQVLQWSELSKKPASSGRLPNLALQLRVSKTLLRSSVLQEEVVSTVMELLSDHLAQWSEHVAFPEVVNTTCVALRRFIKTSAVERFRRAAKQVLDAVDKTATQTRNRRNSVEFSPKDLGLVADFMKEGQKGQQNPLRRLAAELAEKGKQRRALATTAAVDVGDGDEDGSGPEDDEIQIAPDENGYDDSGDDGEEGPTNNAEAFKKPLSKSLKLEGFADGAGDADELRDFELSDDDDSDPDLTPTPSAAPKTKKGSGMMEKAKRSQDTGNHSGGIRKPSHHPKGKGKPGRGQVGKGKGGKGKGKGKGGGKS